ncbi:hypothetical protein MTR67_041273 [Solanum verrucosum]|uniref:DUF4283 domain-containing protein n=1 Tax=Solanum verrucosum TaxID=315347 RepID=A0AAF0UK29_SOLVR|nr:hypothetical protein MTR67_041273 [Solanum verrucosum]
MGENTIFYNAGFKSYEITRCKEGAETWYEWTERSRKLVRRGKISIKVLRWLISVFIEASEVQGDSVKRWKVKNLYSDLFCTLKYNKKGKYISFIAIQGQNKAVIITPESSYNTGWGNIAHKIAKFTYEPTTEQKTQFNKGKALGWSPITGCWPEAVARDWVWIRVLGLPLNLWSHKVFKLIGDQCGGFIKAEEETTLKNHMHWARIKVKGDGKMVPKEIEITSEGFVYTMPIWCEAPMTFRKETTRKKEQHYGRLGNKVNIEIQANLSRITTNKEFEELGNQDTGASNKSSGDQEGRKATDKDAAQIKKKPSESERLSEPFHDEIEANCRILTEQGREGILIPFELGDEGNNLEFVADLSDDDDMSVIQIEESTD